MRISDWSSDVCSSDLLDVLIDIIEGRGVELQQAIRRPGLEADLECIEHLGLRRRVGERNRIEAARLEASIVGGVDVDVLRHVLGDDRAVGQLVEGDIGVDSVGAARSDEHTSELQSLMRFSYAVVCLNKTKQYNT